MNLSEILPSLKKVERKKRFGTPPDRLTPLPPPLPTWHLRLVSNCLVYVYQFLTLNSNFKTTMNLQISYFNSFYLSFEKNYLSPNRNVEM